MPDRVTSPGLSAHDADGPVFVFKPLSRRECEVLAEAAHGLTARETAERLHLAERTVKAHLMSIRRKVGAVNTTHAVAIAVSCQLIKLDTFMAN